MRASRDLAGGDPPDSSRLRIGDDISWADLSAVYDRDDSLKENTNPKCLIKNHHGGGGGGGGASQRFSGNLKPTAASIIGIPGKLGQSARRPQAATARIFPRKAKTGGGGRKQAVPDDEPGSPKVSCIGKVLSDRERERRRRRRRGGAEGRPPPSPEPRPGCCLGVGSLFRRGGARKGAVECVDESPPAPAAAPAGCRVPAAKPEAAAEAPGLGGMKRFASGRRAAEWAAEMDVDAHVSRSGPL